MKARAIVAKFNQLEDYWGDCLHEMHQAYDRYYYDKSLENEEAFDRAAKLADQAWREIEDFLDTEWN